jgi:hypothetical protein
MKISRPTERKAMDHGESPADAGTGSGNAEVHHKKKRPPKLTVELSDEEVEMLAIYVAEHRTSLRQVVRWLIQQLPDLPGGPPLRSQSRPEREERKARGGAG